MKYFYLYKTTNLINNKFYIGVHASHKEHDLNYFGSGVAINRAIEKYGIENFKNEIISYHESLKAAYDAERILVNEELIKQKDCYNMICGGVGGNGENLMTPENLIRMKLPKSQEEKNKISESLKGKCYLTEDGRRRLSDAARGNTYAKGMTYTHSDEAREAISKSRLGKKMSEETKKKFKENRKGKGTGENNAMSREECRNKVRDSKIGLRKLIHPEYGNKLARPNSDKWSNLISQGYIPLNS
jgi:group I intron endonuclease